MTRLQQLVNLFLDSLATCLTAKVCRRKHLRHRKKICYVGNMPEISEQDVAKLVTLVTDLSLFLEELKASEVQVPPEVATEVESQVSNRQCLICGKIVPKGSKERYSRGLCKKHYDKMQTLMRSGKVTMRRLIERGVMDSQVNRGGREREADEDMDRILDELLNRDKPRDGAKPK